MARLAILIPTPRGSRLLKIAERWYAEACPIARVVVCEEGRDYCDMMRRGLLSSPEPYVCMSSDDDFHIARGLLECMNWLDAYPKYDVAHGRALQAGLPESLEIEWTAELSNTPRFFAVHRREAFLASLDAACRLDFGRGRHAMNVQELAFVRQSLRYRTADLDALQVIRGHHVGRNQDRKESAWRGAVERNGGGWLASFLPSRRMSLRALRRRKDPEWMRFEREFTGIAGTRGPSPLSSY